jgi:hypothetical protein
MALLDINLIWFGCITQLSHWGGGGYCTCVYLPARRLKEGRGNSAPYAMTSNGERGGASSFDNPWLSVHGPCHTVEYSIWIPGCEHGWCCGWVTSKRFQDSSRHKYDFPSRKRVCFLVYKSGFPWINSLNLFTYSAAQLKDFSLLQDLQLLPNYLDNVYYES